MEELVFMKASKFIEGIPGFLEVIIDKPTSNL
jgi:hypothetical protein